MDYTHLGRSGLSVSRLCLGTMNFGPQTNEADSFAIMDRAHEAGLNFFDSANVYGWVKGEGITEQIVGRWFAQGGGRREKTVIATKLYGSMSDWPNDTFLSALNIRRACDASLRRLQTDYIDLYQMHHVDRATPWEEIWEAFEVLRQQGKILYAGSSNFAGWHIAQAQEAARARHFLGLVSEQSIYNLLTRDIEREVVPAAETYGLGIIPWSPLHGGLLGGVLRKEQEGKRRTEGRAKEALETHRAPDRAVGGAVRRARCGPLGRGSGVAAAASWRHRPDRRAAHGRAARPEPHGARRDLRAGHAGPARRDLPRVQDGTRGLRLVTPLPHRWEGRGWIRCGPRPRAGGGPAP